jgi:hypothetical protein
MDNLLENVREHTALYRLSHAPNLPFSSGQLTAVEQVIAHTRHATLSRGVPLLHSPSTGLVEPFSQRTRLSLLPSLSLRSCAPLLQPPQQQQQEQQVNSDQLAPALPTAELLLTAQASRALREEWQQLTSAASPGQ